MTRMNLDKGIFLNTFIFQEALKISYGVKYKF
jgi:hypothetical protein